MGQASRLSVLSASCRFVNLRYTIYDLRDVMKLDSRPAKMGARKLYIANRKFAALLLGFKASFTPLGGNRSWRRGLQARRLFHYQERCEALGVGHEVFPEEWFCRQDAGSTLGSRRGLFGKKWIMGAFFRDGGEWTVAGAEQGGGRQGEDFFPDFLPRQVPSAIAIAH